MPYTLKIPRDKRETEDLFFVPPFVLILNELPGLLRCVCLVTPRQPGRESGDRFTDGVVYRFDVDAQMPTQKD